MKKITTILLLMLFASLGFAQTSDYCDTEVTHLNIAAETASAIKLTITNIDATSMYIEIESADSDPVDFLLVNGSGSDGNVLDESVAGKIRRTLSWTTAPVDASFEILWSKVSTGGNWMLNTFTVPFAATCTATPIESDATLSDLKVGTVTIEGFATGTLAYTYGLAIGATIPAVTATATNTSLLASKVVVTNTTTVPGQSTVVVTSEDDSDSKTYTVDFYYTTPTTGATAPTHAEVDVISIFSDTYTDVSGTNFNPGWSQSTVMTTEDIDGNPTMKYASFNYQGTQFGSTVDASSMEYLHIDMWTGDATSVNIYPISLTTGDAYKKELTITSGSWVSYDIPLSYFTDLGASVNDLHQFKFDGGNGAQTIYLDNLYFWKNPTAAGSDASLFDLKVGTETIDGFSANTINYTYGLVEGDAIPTVAATATDDGNATVSITQAVAPLPDTAEIVVLAQDNTTSITYKVAFAFTTPSAGPTAPTHDAANVISIFSDAYTDLSGTDFNPGWGQTTVQTTEDFSGNSLLKYASFNYQGTTFASDIDASGMEYLHIDMYTGNATSVNVYPISQSTGDSYKKELAITTGSWVSYDIPLSYFTNLGASVSDLHQFKFDGGDGSVTIYLDNIYFWKESLVSNSTLSDLKVGGTTISGFGSTVYDYTVILADGAAIPTVEATATNDGLSTVTITQATGTLPASATVVVKSEDETTTKTYTVNFTLAPSSEYCETVVTHFNNEAETASSIYLSIKNVDATSMYVEIESADDDAVDELIVNNGSGATISDKDETVAGKIKRTLTYTTAPDSVEIELLWSKASNGGNWMLNTFKVPFAAICRANTDASLSELEVNDFPVTGFKADSFKYEVELPFGTTDLPVVTATATDKNADVAFTQVTELTGTAKVDVTAEDGTTKLAYEITFSVAATISDDATLQEIEVNESAIASFLPTVYSYSVELPFGTTEVPTVSVITNNMAATYVINKASDLSDTTTVVVTAQDETTIKTYKVSFTIAEPTYNVTFMVTDANAVAVADAEILYMEKTLKTSMAGEAVYEQVSVTTDAEYTITKDGFETYTGKVSVVDADVTVNVELIPVAVPTYKVTFTVVDADANKLADASVTLMGETKVSGADGMAVFESIADATDTPYSISKDGFNIKTGTITVDGKDVALSVELTKVAASYSVTFTVVDENDAAIADAEVSFMEKLMTTNADGIAMYEQVSVTADAIYTISKDDFIEVSGTVSVVDKDVELTVKLSPVGINNSEYLQVDVYPNPTNGLLNVVVSDLSENTSLEVYDMAGRIIKKKKVLMQQMQIDLTENEAGVYFVKITSGNKYKIEKVIVN